MEHKGLEGNFYSPTKGNLSSSQVIEEILSYLKERPEMFYDIIVGCDSSSGQEPNFPVAVAVLRKGEGGRFFLKRVKYSTNFNKRFVNWRNRILQEVLLSCDLALVLREELEKRIDNSFDYQFEYIHADIGEAGATKDMVKELTGLIRGNGFEPIIKPYSCVASVVAHRYS
jgi:predicted RNase H-related nuclease YkuK (DUF458 family)